MATDSILSIKSGVEFVNIKEYYNYNKTLQCLYRLNNYEPQEGDRVAIFLAGWTQVKNYVVFQWASTKCKLTDLHSVSFEHKLLPKNTTDLYQFCYISGGNEVQAASSTFQFCECDKSSSLTSTFDSLAISDTPNPSSKRAQLNRALDMLKESIETIRRSLSPDEPINELRETVAQLQSTVSAQNMEIEHLKSKINQAAEEYRKLYMEKCKWEKMYKKLKNSQEAVDKPTEIVKSYPIDLNFNLESNQNDPQLQDVLRLVSVKRCSPNLRLTLNSESQDGLSFTDLTGSNLEFPELESLPPSPDRANFDISY